jgi:hypothetical protein
LMLIQRHQAYLTLWNQEEAKKEQFSVFCMSTQFLNFQTNILGCNRVKFSVKMNAYCILLENLHTFLKGTNIIWVPTVSHRNQK